jgi:hypothetical protein
MILVQLKNQLLQVVAFIVIKSKADLEDTAIPQMLIYLLDMLDAL